MLPERLSPPFVTWLKLKRPRWWKPDAPEEELIGYYLGQSVRHGRWGEYTVALIAVPGKVRATPHIITGTSLIRMLDGARVQSGTLLRIVFLGWKELSDDRRMRLWDVYVGTPQAEPSGLIDPHAPTTE